MLSLIISFIFTDSFRKVVRKWIVECLYSLAIVGSLYMIITLIAFSVQHSIIFIALWPVNKETAPLVRLYDNILTLRGLHTLFSFDFNRSQYTWNYEVVAHLPAEYAIHEYTRMHTNVRLYMKYVLYKCPQIFCLEPQDCCNTNDQENICFVCCINMFCSLGMGKEFNATFYQTCACFYLLGYKLNHVS